MLSRGFRILAFVAVVVAVLVVVIATTTGRPLGAGAHATHACSAADLEPTVLGSRAVRVGTMYAIGLTNVGASACHTMSFPGVRFFDSLGKRLGQHAKQRFSDARGRIFPNPIVVGPKTQVFFRLTIYGAAETGAACRETSYIEITPPADTVSLKLPFRVSYCGDAYLLPVAGGVPPFRRGRISPESLSRG